jgi:hypothetical protein
MKMRIAVEERIVFGIEKVVGSMTRRVILPATLLTPKTIPTSTAINSYYE